MRLDTISKIEQYMADAIMSSRQIPQGVNVIRLAATNDEEGITQLARSIVVRYTGSNVVTENKVPMVITRTMTFEIQLAAQSYLTESGHDYAIQMCAGTYITLNNRVPSNTGVQITEPLKMVRESFEGLTDSSHYIYTQTWEIEVQEINRIIALDPCVARGNCSFLFPVSTLETLRPGDVMEGNKIFVPVLPPPPGEPINEEWAGVTEKDGNLVYNADPRVVFLYDWQNYDFRSTGTYDTTQTFLIVNIHDRETGEVYDTYFAYNKDNRRLIQVAGNQPGSYNWMQGMFVSGIGRAGLMEDSNGPEVIPPHQYSKNGFLYVNAPKAYVHADPTREDSAKVIVKWGLTLPYAIGSELRVDGETYLIVGGHSLGTGWINERDIRKIAQEKAEPLIECDGEVIQPGIPEGADPENTGPIESCE